MGRGLVDGLTTTRTIVTYLVSSSKVVGEQLMVKIQDCHNSCNPRALAGTRGGGRAMNEVGYD